MSAETRMSEPRFGHRHHWQVAGPTFHQLHLLFDEHAGEQSSLIDAIAERMQVWFLSEHLVETTFTGTGQ